MGGGVMRTAAKVAGVGVVNAGLRGAPAVQPVEQPMAAAARKATVPVSSVISSAKTGSTRPNTIIRDKTTDITFFILISP